MPYLPYISLLTVTLFKLQPWQEAILSFTLGYLFYFFLIVYPSPEYGGRDFLAFMKFACFCLHLFIFSHLSIYFRIHQPSAAEATCTQLSTLLWRANVARPNECDTTALLAS